MLDTAYRISVGDFQKRIMSGNVLVKNNEYSIKKNVHSLIYHIFTMSYLPTKYFYIIYSYF